MSELNGVVLQLMCSTMVKMIDHTNDLFPRVREHLLHATKSVVIVSAYIRSNTLKNLLCGINSNVSITIYARWQIKDLISGASDVMVPNVAQDYNASFLIYPHLHAKIYVADELALVGSANATARGLGSIGSHNLEVLVKHSAQDPDIKLLLDTLLNKAIVPPLLRENDIAELVDMFDTNRSFLDILAGSQIEHWLPQSSPDDVLEYINGGQIPSAKVLHDCIAMNLTQGYDSISTIKQIVHDHPVFAIIREHIHDTKQPLNRFDLIEILYLITNRDKIMIQDNVDLLANWLDKYDDNIYMVHIPGKRKYTLNPGRTYPP